MTPPIEPEAEPLTDREPTVNEVAMLATIDRLTRERDEAPVDFSGPPPVQPPPIAQAALDGEDK